MDEILFRSLKNGNQYNSLFPTVKCEKVALGKGDTDYSIDKMVEWIFKHQNQTQKVSDLLAKSSLQNTCFNFHDFLFWHFQYKADLSDQLLRSPACAWLQRYDGIDCKSYSIIASCLLLNQNINHYIRKVAYTAPGEYSHVYVIVPKNQKTNNLDDGYFMIDGTINTMQEPYYLESKEEFMSLAHFGLNRPQYRQLNGTDYGAILKKLDLPGLKKIYAKIGCIGGSAYTNSILDKNVQKTADFFNQLAVSLNSNIATGNFKEVANDVADFGAYSEALYEGSHAVDAFGDWNPCTTANLQAFQKVMLFYRDAVTPLLKQYIDTYFNKTVAGQHTYTTNGLEADGWDFEEIAGYEWTVQRDYYNLTLKPGITQIPAFEFTQPIVNAAANGTAINFLDYLPTLQNIINVAQTTQPTDTSSGTYATDTNADGTPKKSSSGIGTVLGIGAVGLAIKYLIFS